MRVTSRVSFAVAAVAAIGLAGAMVPVHAFELYKSGGLTVNGDFSAALAVINSERSYNPFGLAGKKAGKRTWFEGLGTYGVSGSYQLGNNNGTLFGAFDLFSGADQGDADAAFITSGDEYQTQIQNAYIGWKSGDTIPWLGHDGLKISAGRQAFVLGTGFLIRGDQISFGNSFSGAGFPGGIERAGGTYYLGSLNSFSKTALLDLGGKEGFHFKAFWLASDNKAQDETHLAGTNLEYRSATYGTIGLTYLRGLSASQAYAAFSGYGHRQGQNIWSAYGNTSLGVKQLNIDGQYVYEANNGAGGASRAHAWYAGVSWIFDKVPWTPKVTYRFNRFGPGYDTLFYGFNDFGAWFIGEVAANYAGPFNTSADIQMAKLSVQPTSNLQLATYYSHFGNIPSGAPKLQGNEVDAYASWTVFDHYTLIPLVGYYKPKHSAADGGTQLGGNGPNIYSELLLFVSF